MNRHGAIKTHPLSFQASKGFPSIFELALLDFAI